MVYRSANQHTFGGGALHIRFSDDYGATWTAEDTDLDGDPVSGFPMGPPVDTDEEAIEPWLYLAPSGRLILHMWRYSWPSVSDGTYQSVSDNAGKTWSAAAAVTFTGYAGGNIIYTTDDYFVHEGVIYAGGRETVDISESQIRSIFVKTEDEGDTWDFVANISGLSPGTSEVGLEYLGNNAIVAVMRSRTNAYTYKSVSADMGATWSAIVDISNTVLVSGRHRIWTRTHLEGSSAAWWTDTYLVMSGFVFTADSKRRACLWFSKDSGVNWSAPHYVDDAYADGGYGDLFYNPNTDEYVFMCYRGLTTKADLVQYNLSVSWGS